MNQINRVRTTKTELITGTVHTNALDVDRKHIPTSHFAKIAVPTTV